MTDFIVVGNSNAVTCKEVFPLIKEGKMGLGYRRFSGVWKFVMNENVYDPTKEKDPAEIIDGKIVKGLQGVVWFTSFPAEKRPLVLTKSYSPEKYPKYDNYDAINIDRIKDIPYDYDGVMGVPVTILNYDLNDFEIVKFRKGDDNKDLCVNGEDKYFRILIKKKFEIIGGFNGYKESDKTSGLICGTPTEYIDKNGKSKYGMGRL